MFGEYCVYLHGKPVGFVCDDQLFVKPVQPPLQHLQGVPQGHAYPGSKLYFQLGPDRWEDRDWLSGLIDTTAAALPKPKPKKPKQAK